MFYTQDSNFEIAFEDLFIYGRPIAQYGWPL